MTDLYCPECGSLLEIASVGSNFDLDVSVDLECKHCGFTKSVDFNIGNIKVRCT